MRNHRRVAAPLFCLGVFLGGSGIASRPSMASEDFGSGLVLDLRAARPVGAFGKDVNQQFGFGLSVGYQQQLWSKIAFRGAFTWTGYRVNDRNLTMRILANLLDAKYTEDRLVLRSYALGGDLIGYQEEGCYGFYALAGGGIQRARMYGECRTVDGNSETVEQLRTWPALDSGYFNVGLGQQWLNGGFIETRAVYWQYRAVPGVQLLHSRPNQTHYSRDALSLTLGLGARF